MAGSGTAHLRDDALLRVEHLVVEYPTRSGTVHAVSDVSFDIAKGETLGLVGESGCGKSTVAKSILQLPPPTSGSVTMEGESVVGRSARDLRRLRSRLQIIFQDPISSLNPRRSVKKLVAEGLEVRKEFSKEEIRVRVEETLESVGIDPETAGDRLPREFSGGQCQRICIARALVLEPRVVVCDEPVSALDVSVQAQILNLLRDMKDRYGLTLLFIAHDLAVVKSISDRIAVMYLGKMCEIADSEALSATPLHPYTRALLDAVPEPDPDAAASSNELSGEIPSPMRPPSGCRFRTRCPRAQARCAADEPELRELMPGHFVACHFPLEPAASNGNGHATW
jgi:peptide/nickel transport system ATP-binding protein